MADPATPVDPAAAVDPPAPAPDPAPPADDNPLGPEGEKALAAWKERAKAAEAEAKRVKALEDELAALREAQMSDDERKLEEAKRAAADEARRSALGEVSERLFRSELRAAVAGKMSPEAANDLLSDAQVATKLLGLGEIPVTENGDIDSEAISQAVVSYVEARPYLTASATRPAGSADQGTRTPPASKDLDAQISEAEAKGDWGTARRLKLHKLAALPRP